MQELMLFKDINFKFEKLNIFMEINIMPIKILKINKIGLHIKKFCKKDVNKNVIMLKMLLLRKMKMKFQEIHSI